MYLSNTALSNKLKDISIMYEIASSIGLSLDIAEEANSFLEKILKRFNIEVGTILIKDTGDTFVITAAKGFTDAGKYIGIRFSPNQYGVEDVVTKNLSIVKNALTDKDREWIISKELRSKINSLAFLSIPFEHGVIGVLRLFSFREDVFSPRFLKMLEPLLKRFGVTVHHINIVEKLRLTERAIQIEKERLLVTLYSIGDGVIVTDTESKVTLLNKVAEDLTGWTAKEAAGMNLTDVFNIVNEKTRAPAKNPVEKALKTGMIEGLANHTALISRNGVERSIADSAAPIMDMAGNIIGVVLVFRDVTEKHKMEEAILKARKLESVGVLAGGIAHDFNNILTAILGNISLAMNFTEPKDKIYQRLEKAEKATERAMDLSQQLLTFSKGGAPVLKAVSIKDIINETVCFTLRGSDVRCDISIPEDLWLVDVDAGQMSQVMQNLVINAQQAMPEGGIINVWAENITIKKGDALPLKDGNYVKLSIKDHGVGILQEHLPKIFDPYFSTKQTGSGLGLATAYSIVKKHEGHISAESRVGEGTTFYVYIPASEKQILHEKKEKEESLIITGRGKILIMDDEEVVRDVAGEVLKHLGYEVTFAKEGKEAVELYKKTKEEGEPFDAVILDLTIPGGMGGKETMERLLEIDPDVIAIVSSGYSNEPVMAEYEKYGFKGAAAKPYSLKEMREVISKVLRK